MATAAAVATWLLSVMTSSCRFPPVGHVKVGDLMWELVETFPYFNVYRTYDQKLFGCFVYQKPFGSPWDCFEPHSGHGWLRRQTCSRASCKSFVYVVVSIKSYNCT